MENLLTFLHDYFPSFTNWDFIRGTLQINKPEEYIEFRKLIKKYHLEKHQEILYTIWDKIFYEWWIAKTNKRFAESKDIDWKDHEKQLIDVKNILLSDMDVSLSYIELKYKTKSDKSWKSIKVDNEVLLHTLNEKSSLIDNLRKALSRFQELPLNKPRIKSHELDFVKEWLYPLHKLLTEEKGLNIFPNEMDSKRFISEFCRSFGFNLESAKKSTPEDYLTSSFKKC